MQRSPMYQWQMLNTSLVWAYHGPVLPQFRSTYVGGSFMALWRVVQGEVLLKWGAEEARFGRDNWVVVPPGRVHQTFSEDAEIWSVRFVLNTSANECLLDFTSPFELVAPTQGLIYACQHLIELVMGRYGMRQMELLESECTLVEHLQLETVYREFLQEVIREFARNSVPMRPQGSMDIRLQHCIWQVRNSPLSRQYTESHLAEFAGVSVSQLNRLFQEQFGHTSRVWVDNYRFHEAQRLLDSRRPIKEVSYALGFSSPQHFASWFRKQSGHTPSAWRKLAVG